jgi:hypothetical protein
VTEFAIAISRVGAELAVAAFLAAALWRTIAAAARDAYLGNGNAASHAHLAIQTVAIAAMLVGLAAIARC